MEWGSAQVWRGTLDEVTNSNEPRLQGKLAVAGYDKELWDPKPEHLPATARMRKIIARFYQVRTEPENETVYEGF